MAQPQGLRPNDCSLNEPRESQVPLRSTPLNRMRALSCPIIRWLRGPKSARIPVWVCGVVMVTGCVYGTFERDDRASLDRKSSAAQNTSTTSKSIGGSGGSSNWSRDEAFGGKPHDESGIAQGSSYARGGTGGELTLFGGSAGEQNTGTPGLDGAGTAGQTAAIEAGSAGWLNVPTPTIECDQKLEIALGNVCVTKQAVVGRAPLSFAIDVTEVTQRQYAQWLRAGAAGAATLSKDTPLCQWNTSLEPSRDGSCAPGADPRTCAGPNCENYPQTCVDWCDAYAYCAGVGKRLCGRIGGGHIVYEDLALGETASSQWYAACSSEGLHEYPYGDVYQPKYCNTYDYWLETGEYRMLPVNWLQTCQANEPFAGVFDLSGNVWEWEDACRTDTNTMTSFCRKRGGDFSETTDSVRCSLEVELAPAESHPRLGFRCCTD